MTRRWTRGWALGLCLAAGLWAAPATAAACRLTPVSKGKSDLVVYFTKFAKEDKTGGRYKKCRLVSKPGPETKTFRVTRFRQDANVVVLRSNWP